MASECHPTLNTFYVIKHDPNGLEITPKLHMFNYFTTTTSSMHRHLEQKLFFPNLLLWKITILNVIVTNIRFQSDNVKNIPSIPWLML
jgi:hypothetical protein